MKVFNFFRSFFVFITMLCMMNLVSAQSTVTIKLDTAGVYPYPTSYNFCTSDVDSVYLIQPTISGMTGVRWYIPDFPTQPYYNDTVLIVPQYEGMVQMNSNQGYMRELGIWFYETPPSHADFYVVSGGQINAAQDTVFMCSGSVTVATNADGNEATSWYWGSTTGFYSVDAPVIITLPGKYFLERADPCGVTIDTFEVVMLPTVLPVWQDTSFCNTPVSLTLDPGPGWNYLWNAGATTQTLSVDTAGVYSVTLSNVCSTGGIVSITVEHQSYPMPDLLSYDSGSAICADSILVLDPSPGHSYDTYQWQWSGGTANTPTLSVSGLTTGSGTYAVTVTQGGCTTTAGVWLNFFETPDVPEICIVTVNPVVNKNIVVWSADHEPMSGDLQHSLTANYNIYKWAGGTNWVLLGTTAVDQDHVFTDITSNPPSVSARYKIAMVDACGVESAKSYYHKTIHLSSSLGSIPGEVNLDWGSDGGYEDESGTFVVDQYQIWRGNHPDSLVYYDQTPFTAYTDQGVVGQKYYQIVVTKVGGCNSDPAGSKGGGTKSLIPGSASNIINNIITTVITEYNPISVSIYPNPASDGIFHVEASDLLEIVVTDQLGRVLASFKNTSIINLSGFAQGVYYARVSTSRGSTVVQLMVK